MVATETMRRADRLFDIIQSLRSAASPVTAAALAERLEVTPRTVYRDIAALQASRVPIEGAAGLGYVLRRGFDLPPLMFTAEEADAIAVGVRLLRRLRDPKLQEAAETVLGKLAAVVPGPLQPQLVAAPVYVSDGIRPEPKGVDPAELRAAIRDGHKVRISYRDESGHATARTVWPVAMAYYIDVTVLAGWCELRHDFRHFRVDRIGAGRVLDEPIPGDRHRLLAQWLALKQARPDPAP
jgi:predicted DNA-binding transcriptional regulator YafY